MSIMICPRTRQKHSQGKPYSVLLGVDLDLGVGVVDVVHSVDSARSSGEVVVSVLVVLLMNLTTILCTCPIVMKLVS